MVGTSGVSPFRFGASSARAAPRTGGAPHGARSKSLCFSGVRKTFLRPTPFLPARASTRRAQFALGVQPRVGRTAGVLFAPEEKLMHGAALPFHGLEPGSITDGF